MKKAFSVYFLLGAALIAATSLFSSCKKENFNESASAELKFNTDTILFDTVFTTIGSTTQALKVYNNYDKSIRISQIRLEGGSSSQFRINVDGTDGYQYSDIEILPNDSIYIFVEVTVDPGNSNLPFIIEDNIVFNLNGNEQVVNLAAWGQDAYFHGGLGELFILEPNEIWNNDKPHVIYGIVAVDEGNSLTINAGTRVYCHSKSGLYIYKGTLDINGELNNEVVFNGDRLESDYIDLPGQWGIQLEFLVESGGAPTVASVARGGIWLVQCTNSEIDYAILKNGGMGIQVDTTGVPYTSSEYSLEVRNTKIYNMSGVGLFGQGGSIKGENLLVANCGQSCAYFSIGGKYTMDNCTFANYWTEGNRTAPAFAINNYYEDINENIQVRPIINSSFTNCIMYGNNALLSDFNEFVVDVVNEGTLEYSFNTCLLDTDINVDTDTHFSNTVNGQGPPFCDVSTVNFRLSNNPGAVSGIPNGVNSDILGNFGTGDWKGCYDYTGNCN